MELQSIGQQRVIVRANVQSIPGNPLARPFVLGDLFSEHFFHRTLRTVRSKSYDGFDAIHLLPGFDSGDSLQGWFIYDLGVKHEIGKQDLLALPHFKYSAYFDEREQRWIWTPRPVPDRLIQYLAMYEWGAGDLDLANDDPQKTDEDL